MSRIISIASGKGGVGKTSQAVNLAYCLALQDKRTCLLDADLGLANVDVLLGLQPEYTLDQALLQGDVPLQDCLIPLHRNLDILPGASGVPNLAALPARQRTSLLQGLQGLQRYDYLLIDNSPGLTPMVLSFCLASKEIVLVVTPEATSLADAFGLLKSLRQGGLQYPPFLLMNKIRSKRQAQKIWHNFRKLCKERLGLSLLFLGLIPQQELFEQELIQQRPIVELMPDSQPARIFWLMASRLRRRPRQGLFQLQMQEFWNQALLQYTERSPSCLQSRGTAAQADLFLDDPEHCMQIVRKGLQQLLQLDAPWPKRENILQGLDLARQELEQAITRLQQDQDWPEQDHNVVGIKIPETEIREVFKDFLDYLPQCAAQEITDPQQDLTGISALICSRQGLAQLPRTQPQLLSPVPLLLLDCWGQNPWQTLDIPPWLELRQLLAPPYDLQALGLLLEDMIQVPGQDTLPWNTSQAQPGRKGNC